MATNDTLPLVDRLKAQQERMRVELQQAGADVRATAASGAMRFKIGDQVIDTATGQRATVRAAEPRAGTKAGLYALDLVDGRVVLRGEDELRADAPPTTV